MLLYRVTNDLKNSTLTEQGVSSFLPDFINYVNDNGGNDYPNTAKNMDKDVFYNHLYNFMCSPDGANYHGSIKWNKNLNCSESNPDAEIIALTFDYSHRHSEISTDLIGYMNSVTDIIDADTTLGSTGKVFAHSADYSSVVTLDNLIADVTRNTLLAILCIFLVTLLLLSNLVASGMVLVCVMITILDTAGFLWWWGLTIDPVSSLLLTVRIFLVASH